MADVQAGPVQSRDPALGTAIEVLQHNARERESGIALTAHESEAVLAVIVAAVEFVEIIEAATALYEEVEMAEAIGICLPDRVPSLRLGEALRERREQEDAGA